MPLVSVKCIPSPSVDPQNFRSFCRFSMLVYDSRVHWRKVSTYMLAHVTTRLLPKSGQLRISYRDLRMSLFSPLLHVPWWLHEVFVRHAALPLFRAADAIYVLCVRSCVRVCVPACLPTKCTPILAVYVLDCCRLLLILLLLLRHGFPRCFLGLAAVVSPFPRTICKPLNPFHMFGRSLNRTRIHKSCHMPKLGSEKSPALPT